MRVLILGGTTEASAIARRLVEDTRFEATLSLAGRTENPATPAAVTLRTGGFGGAEGLARWLADNAIEAVLDATHPFAVRISANAVAATEAHAIPLCTVVRAPWTSRQNETWRMVESMEEAAHTLGTAPKRVLLSVGRQGVGAFRSAPHHAYIIRTIEPPDPAALPPDTTLIQARGPFALENEIEILATRKIDILVTKNAGGTATRAKIDAARHLGLPVVMIARPHKASRHVVTTAEDAIAWLAQHHAMSRSDRGV